jgi:hypothetical protein
MTGFGFERRPSALEQQVGAKPAGMAQAFIGADMSEAEAVKAEALRCKPSCTGLIAVTFVRPGGSALAS